MLNTTIYKDLSAHYLNISKLSLLDLFAKYPDRANKYRLSVNGLTLDFSKNNIDDETITKLTDLASQSKLLECIHEMFSGCKINNTEDRAVLHTALRAKDLNMLTENDVMPKIYNVLRRMQSFSEKLHNKEYCGYSGIPITDIVNIGIGGSDLGPNIVCEALKPYRKNSLNIHFVSSVDGYQILDTLSNLNPQSTLFVIASKTFMTEETIINANTAKQWFLNNTNNNFGAVEQHFLASSTNLSAVTQFGINPNNMFEFWDFVGGRYSLWSSIGLSIVLYIGFDNFTALLDGANAMDKHFIETTCFKNNMPVVLALIDLWYINFYNYTTKVISPYNVRLAGFPKYVQQLEMESNGKSVDKHGNLLNYQTCPIIWGGSGINGQHAYYQLLHQGTSIHPMDIILALSDKFSNKIHNQVLQSNAIAQAEALMVGKTYTQAKSELITKGFSEEHANSLARHRVFKGNRPTNMITLPEISPYYLGGLIALYEHKTFVQGVIWRINSFDQWGVELGKELAKNVLQDIKTNNISKHDESTNNIISSCINL